MYLDGAVTPAASTSSTATVLTGLTPNSVYAITVVTVDVAGNRSLASLPVLAVTDPPDTVPPTTTLTLSPSSPDGSNQWYVTTPTVTLSSSEPGSSYYDWTDPTGPFSEYLAPFSALAGDRTLFYYSADMAGNEELVQNAQIKTDVDPPSASTLVTVTAVTTSTADIAWEAGTDALSGVAGYDVYADGTLAASTSATGAVLTGLAPSTAYSITVVTIDAAGNRSGESAAAYAVTDLFDPNPPTTSLALSPPTPDGSNGWYVSTPLISLTSSKPGTSYYSWTSSTGPFSEYLGAFSADLGDQRLYYYSVDTASHEEAVQSTPIKTDVDPPTASTLVTVTAVTTSTADVAWQAGTDGVSGVSGYEVYLDGAVTPAASTSATGTVLTGLTPSTVYAVTVVTIDVAGNRSPVSLPANAITDPLDITPPTTNLTVSPLTPDGNSGWYVNTPTVTLSSSEPGTTYYGWSSPTGPFSAYLTPFSALAGNQTLYYYSADAAGNEEILQNAQIKTDVDPPSASTLVTVTAVTTSTADIAWEGGTDAVSGVSGYEVYADGTLAASTSATATVLSGLAPNTSYEISVVHRRRRREPLSRERLRLRRHGPVRSQPPNNNNGPEPFHPGRVQRLVRECSPASRWPRASQAAATTAGPLRPAPSRLTRPRSRRTWVTRRSTTTRWTRPATRRRFRARRSRPTSIHRPPRR